MELVWDIEPDKMIEQMVNRYVADLQKGLLAIAKRRAPEITQWMKDNKVWSDITYEAVSTLHTEVEQVEQEIVDLLMAHGALHGWYLEGFTPMGEETRQGGKFSILTPATDVWGMVLADDLRRLVGG